MCKLTGRNATTQILLNMALKTHNSNLYVTFQYINAIANLRKDSEVDFSSDPQSELYADDDYLIFSRGNKHEVCSLHLEASIYRVYIVLSNKMYIKEGYSFFLSLLIFNLVFSICVVLYLMDFDYHFSLYGFLASKDFLNYLTFKCFGFKCFGFECFGFKCFGFECFGFECSGFECA
jgi:hypothetical protein